MAYDLPPSSDVYAGIVSLVEDRSGGLYAICSDYADALLIDLKYAPNPDEALTKIVHCMDRLCPICRGENLHEQLAEAILASPEEPSSSLTKEEFASWVNAVIALDQ